MIEIIHCLLSLQVSSNEHWKQLPILNENRVCSFRPINVTTCKDQTDEHCAAKEYVAIEGAVFGYDVTLSVGQGQSEYLEKIFAFEISSAKS